MRRLAYGVFEDLGKIGQCLSRFFSSSFFSPPFKVLVSFVHTPNEDINNDNVAYLHKDCLSTRLCIMPKPCQLFVQKYASRYCSLESFPLRPVAAEPFCSRKWKIDRQAVHDPFLCHSKVATQISNFYRMRSRPFLRSAGWGAVSSVVVSVSKKKKKKRPLNCGEFGPLTQSLMLELQ